jgi:hypothetical protein
VLLSWRRARVFAFWRCGAESMERFCRKRAESVAGRASGLVVDGLELELVLLGLVVGVVADWRDAAAGGVGMGVPVEEVVEMSDVSVSVV